MASYVTLKQNGFAPIQWHKILHVLPEQGIDCEASVQLMSLDSTVSVVSISDIDKVVNDNEGGVL